jgi:predicted nucleic acid-binding protein
VAKIFIDTNIFVYTLDKYDKNKQKIARKTVKNIVENDNAVISTQVLQEFYNL